MLSTESFLDSNTFERREGVARSTSPALAVRPASCAPRPEDLWSKNFAAMVRDSSYGEASAVCEFVITIAALPFFRALFFDWYGFAREFGPRRLELNL